MSMLHITRGRFPTSESFGASLWSKLFKAFTSAASECVSTWRRRIRQRNELMTLSDHELSDFMCSRSDARAEASKWFWQA
jgi:uncharacterized protein YjiS (DUF1127 family)